LGDDTLLNYAISRISIDEFPSAHKDMVYYRIGEFQLRNQQYEQAAKTFAHVQPASTYYPKTKYLEGLAWSEAKNPAQAVRAFDELADVRSSAPVTDIDRVSAVMGKARALYQKKDWDGAIDSYRDVPRDSELWHDTLFESSWAMLRSGKFRSALSNFQSLHSTYYEDTYNPESLLLRSIVYLYICKYDEMEKVLNLFAKLYKPVYRDVDNLLAQNTDPIDYYNPVIRAMHDYHVNGDDINKKAYKLPFVVIRKINKEADFQNSYAYIKNLLSEQKRINGAPASWRNSNLGKYALRVLQTRLQKAKQRTGLQIKAHLEAVREELVDLFEQEGFIRYEMINGKKEGLKKRLAGKDLPKGQIDEENHRDYYVQNGWEYWPFRGEYWLDELGNYHYVGTQSCE
jgi:TolA-binding protein